MMKSSYSIKVGFLALFGFSLASGQEAAASKDRDFRLYHSFSPLEAAGWFESNDAVWHADSNLCLLKTSYIRQPFPILREWEKAVVLSEKIKGALEQQGLNKVVTEPLSRPDQWAILASYEFTTEGTVYKTHQIYLAEEGYLRTFTGSSATNESNICVEQMQRFLRLEAL